MNEKKEQIDEKNKKFFTSAKAQLDEEKQPLPIKCTQKLKPFSKEEPNFSNDVDFVMQSNPTEAPVEPPPLEMLTVSGRPFEVETFDSTSSLEEEPDPFASSNLQPAEITRADYFPPKQPVASDTLQEIVTKMQLQNVGDALAIHAANREFDAIDPVHIRALQPLTPPRRRSSPPQRSRSGLAVQTAISIDESSNQLSCRFTDPMAASPSTPEASNSPKNSDCSPPKDADSPKPSDSPKVSSPQKK